MDENVDAHGEVAEGQGGSFLIRAIPDGAWEGSTWSTCSAASMNDVDAEEHRQTIGRAGTALVFTWRATSW